MCGFCGAVRAGKAGAIGLSDMRRMVHVLKHRGPDDARVLDEGEVLLGHTRLSTIDLATGQQPMTTYDGTLWITFNGEIYNYLELREELRARGHRFLTQSDTEVVLMAYREWGQACLTRFNGQWAFALWDKKRRSLVLSRDPMGIRPLYYAFTGGNMVFASEIKALMQLPELRQGLSPSGVAESFTFWAPVAPRTAFRGIYQLEPGCSMLVPTSRGALGPQVPRVTSYFFPGFGADAEVRNASLEENTERFRELFTRAVRLRFDRSDVPVGAYLSGGIDSSVTTAVVSSSTPTPIETFSLSFEDPEFDESSYQQAVAQALGTSHHTVDVSYRDIGTVFPAVVRHAEQPMLRAAPAPLFLLSGLVRESGYKVVVTGEGADEMLAGYDIFREATVRRFLARDPDSELRREILFSLYPWMKRSPTRVPAFAEAFFSQAADPSDPAFSHRPRWRASSTLLRMLSAEFGAPKPGVVEAELLQRLPEEFHGWRPLEQAQYLEWRTLLSGYILAAQGDRMLMSHSVEGRFPFLDPEVMRFAASLPPRQKLMGMDEKHILKRAFGHRIPDTVRRRPKQPYRAPDAASFAFAPGTLPWLDALLAPEHVKETGLFVPKAVEVLLRKCREQGGMGMSNTDNMRLLAVISTMLLAEECVGSAEAAHEDGAAASGVTAVAR